MRKAASNMDSINYIDYSLRGYSVEVSYRNDKNGNGYITCRSLSQPKFSKINLGYEFGHLSHCDPRCCLEAAKLHLVSLGRVDGYELSSWAAIVDGFVFIFR